MNGNWNENRGNSRGNNGRNNGRSSDGNRVPRGNFNDDRQPVVPNQPFYERPSAPERAESSRDGNQDGGGQPEHQIYKVDGRLPQDLVSDNDKWAERRGVEQWYLHAYKRRFGPESVNGHVVREAFNISFVVQAVTELSSKATREIVKEELYEDVIDEDGPSPD